MKMYTPEEAKEIRERDWTDTRNVRDEFKGKSREDIKRSMPHNDLVVMMSNRIRDFNWGTVVRNANAFGAKECVFTGKRRYDRRGTVGAHHYTNIKYEEDIFTAIDHYRNSGYTIVAAEYDPKYKMSDITDYTWNSKTVLIFGEEGVSIDESILDICDDIVKIDMYGTVRSINVGTASGIFMHAFAMQHPPRQTV